MLYFFLLATLLTFSTAAAGASFDPPKRKSGLWEIKISSAQAGGSHMMQQCVDEKSDDLAKNDMRGTQKSSCSKNEFHKEGDKIVHDSVCKVDGSTAKTRSIFSGRFDSAYKVESKSTFEPPMEGMRETSSRMEGKWLGACKPGQKSGDISMPGMPNINMDEIMKNLPKNR